MLLCILLGWRWLAEGQPPETTHAEFPFEFREGLLWVEVRVPETNRVLNFLLDSGAEASVVNLETARELGLALGQRANVRGVGVSMEGFWTATRAAKASEVNLPNKLLALDLGKLSRACHRRVDGLIGADFFKSRAVEIDFRQGEVRLLDLTASNAAEALPLDVRHCGMRVKAGINGKRAKWLRIDTGCASPLQWVTGDINPKNCTSKIAVGLTATGVPQTKTMVKIGRQVMTNVETGVHTSPIFDGEAGLIGNGLLSQFETVTLDAPAGKLLLGARLN